MSRSRGATFVVVLSACLLILGACDGRNDDREPNGSASASPTSPGSSSDGGAAVTPATIAAPGFEEVTVVSGLDQPTNFAFAPDGRICTGGADGLLKLWKPDGGPLKTFENLGDWVYEVCFVDQGRRAIGGTWTGQLHVFDCESGQRRQQFDTNPSPTPPATETLSE